MHGWPELAETVARIYDALPPGQRAQAAVVASNYGEAAAIDFFGARYGLPPAISGHNNYWLWGPHGYSGNVVIDVNGDCGAAGPRLSNLAPRDALDSPWVHLVRAKHPDHGLHGNQNAALGALAEAARLHLASRLRSGLAIELALRSQTARWSLTIPTACMNA